MGWSELRAMRTDEWKLIVAPHPELYNLERDPGESEDLISRFPADADALQKKIWEIAGNGARQERVSTSPMDAEARQELESLGYVSGGSQHEIQLGTDAPDPKDRVGMLKIFTDFERLLKAKSYAAAAAEMTRGLKLDPTNPLAHVDLGTCFEKMGQPARAVQIYEEAIGINIGTDQIYARLGKDELRLHELDKAVNAMVHANQINPTDLDNLRNLGTAYLQLGRVDDAEKAFKAVTVQNAKYAAAWNGLGLVAIQRNDADSARRNFEKALAVGPDEVEPLLNLGLLYQKTGNKEQAIHYFELFLKKAPREDYAPLIPKVREAIQQLRSGS
jgi:tetratricopeptide (TPR) repeat protein